MNGGKIDYIGNYSGGKLNMIEGEIETANFSNGGAMVMTGGKITDSFILGNNGGDIDITIGDKNLEVNCINPVINNMYVATGDLLGLDTAIIRYYNGIIINDSIHEEYTDEIDYCPLCNEGHEGEQEFIVRSGYSVYVMKNTSTGKYEHTLQTQ